MTTQRIRSLLPTPGQKTALNDSVGTGPIVLDSDTRLTNSRTPLGHKTSHESGGSDALMDETAPSTQAFDDAAATGTALVAAKRDHKHAMPANPVTTKVESHIGLISLRCKYAVDS